MKYKYVYAQGKLLIEDECIAFLEDMSKQGWKLKKVLFSLFVFEKCDKSLKYQLDYSNYDQEYINAIEQMGYEYICLFNDIKFYCHKDLNAIDLQTDSTTHELNILKRYKILYLIFELILLVAMFLVCFSSTNYSTVLREEMPADFYIHFNQEVLAWGIFVLMFYVFLQFIKNINIRYNIKHRRLKKDSLICFHPLFRLFQFVSLIVLSAFIIFLFYFSVKPLILISIFLIACFFSNISQILFNDQKYSKKKNIKVKLIAYTFTLLAISLIIFQAFMKDKPIFNNIGDSKPYYQYVDLEANKESNLYLTKLEFSESGYFEDTEDNKYHSETYYDVNEKKVAQIIFEQLIIDNEFLTNETRIEEADKPIEERKEIKHKTYEQVKQKYNQYKTSYADICYYYKNQLIAINDSQILECTLDDSNEINSILKHYFN